MKPNSAIWNSFVSASFCALLALLALVPRANCCCAPVVENNRVTVQEMHDCCKPDSESSNSNSVSSKTVHMGGACACVIPFIALTERQTKDASAESQAAANKAALSENLESFSSHTTLAVAEPNLKLLALQNDGLKPSKIYLLKRALLN
jgi:hypothetical protein